MKMTTISAAVAAALVAASLAASPAFAGAQQEKMKACNKEAGDKQIKGEERKKFMKECLSAKPAAEPGAAATPAATAAAPAAGSDAKKAQQEKMKACNKEAGDKQLKGPERKKFMSDCLKG
jgi:hypothetical protein